MVNFDENRVLQISQENYFSFISYYLSQRDTIIEVLLSFPLNTLNVEKAWAAPAFLSWGQRGGRQKGTGGNRRLKSEWSYPSTQTPVKPTQNIRFNEHLPTSSSFHPFPP